MSSILEGPKREINQENLTVAQQWLRWEGVEGQGTGTMNIGTLTGRDREVDRREKIGYPGLERDQVEAPHSSLTKFDYETGPISSVVNHIPSSKVFEPTTSQSHEVLLIRRAYIGRSDAIPFNATKSIAKFCRRPFKFILDNIICWVLVQLKIATVKSSGSTPAYVWRESGKPFRKTTLSTPDRDLTLDISIIDGPVYFESSTLRVCCYQVFQSRLFIPRPKCHARTVPALNLLNLEADVGQLWQVISEKPRPTRASQRRRTVSSMNEGDDEEQQE
uniref:Uncharacterized protein n=1 Tax=Timema poppense TaxID=170557 RepID=A0A7R9H6H4_TIMPO|nr:unnamed protein product [Timema poppensis]